MTGIAFLIDADNLAAPQDLEEAFAHLERRGEAVGLRRAYGGLEKLAGLRDVLKRYAVKAIINQGKGTTDVALVVDAMDLLHHAGLPSTVAIGSSDADFAPLAMRLREAGITVLCFAIRGKSDPEALALAYREVIYLGEAGTPHPPPEKKPPAARKSRVASATAKRVAQPKPPIANPEVQAILDAIPELQAGKKVRLDAISATVKRPAITLRRLKVFTLTPELKPTHAQWTGQTSG